MTQAQEVPNQSQEILAPVQESRELARARRVSISASESYTKNLAKVKYTELQLLNAEYKMDYRRYRDVSKDLSVERTKFKHAADYFTAKADKYSEALVKAETAEQKAKRILQDLESKLFDVESEFKTKWPEPPPKIRSVK